MTRSTRLLATSLGAIIACIALAAPASAHVTVNPNEAEQGGFAKFTFRVPNERPTAGTSQLEINLPPEQPFRSVSVRPTPGWTYVTEKTPLTTPITNSRGEQTTETVTKITWSGGLIKPGEFEEFDVSVGPLPENANEIVFKALQTYEGGEVVRWIDVPAPGGAEPEHPAPVVKLVAATEEAAAATNAADVGATKDISVANVASKSEVDDAQRIAIIGIVIGALGLIAAGVALVTRKRTSTT